MPVPVEVQFSLFSKILPFDRNFKTRAESSITIGILYQRTFRMSLHAKEDMVRLLQASRRTIDGKPVRFVELDLTEDLDSLNANLLRSVDVLYVAPLRAVNISSISTLTRTQRILSLTGVPEYVANGLAVGIGTKGERPEILINLSAAKTEGADFSSQLLKLAKVFP